MTLQEFDRCYRRYRPLVHHLAKKMSGRWPWWRADLKQAAWLRVQKLDLTHVEREQQFIMVCCRRAMADELRYLNPEAYVRLRDAWHDGWEFRPVRGGGWEAVTRNTKAGYTPEWLEYIA